jgi:hypothetical protein
MAESRLFTLCTMVEGLDELKHGTGCECEGGHLKRVMGKGGTCGAFDESGEGEYSGQRNGDLKEESEWKVVGGRDGRLGRRERRDKSARRRTGPVSVRGIWRRWWP